MSDRIFWNALNQFPKFGPKAFAKLWASFDSMEQAFYASLEELVLTGIPQTHLREFVHRREQISPERAYEQLGRAGISFFTFIEEGYPPLLKEIYDPPPVLYVKGELPAPEIAHLAVVGSRKATEYGLRGTATLVEEIAQSGAVIVSGLAYGIDEAAHKATLQAQGITIAVLACGLDRLATREYFLAEKIVENGGAIVSEFPLGTHAMKHHFPIRNRIISGLSHGTLVIEATEKSGSLITAKSALEQGRDVFAVPGPINSPSSQGTNNLLKTGAHVVTEAADVLDLLQVEHVTTSKPKPTPDSKQEGLLLEHLSKTPVHIDELTRLTKLSPSEVAGTLSLMEMKGRARQIGGMYYILT